MRFSLAAMSACNRHSRRGKEKARKQKLPRLAKISIKS
jgi:hypothetical protein